MLQLKAFTFNPFQENTYIIYNEKNECWIIDPGMSNGAEENVLVSYINDNNLKPQQIINTHAHIDHILGVSFLKTQYQIPYGIHSEELPVLMNALSSATMFGIPMSAPPTHDFLIASGKELKLGDDTLEVRFVPGHSPGSILYYYEAGAWAIVGDAIFDGSIGRTDLPGGDFDTLARSIRKEIYSLPPDTVLYSGHGGATTVGKEMATNPFVRAT